MSENIPFGVKLIRSPNLPVELFNEETKEVEVFHMIQKGILCLFLMSYILI